MVRAALGAAPAMSLGEDNSWRSLATAAAVACVWAILASSPLPEDSLCPQNFGSSARRSGWNARLAGVLLASSETRRGREAIVERTVPF